jgi:protein-tyrosine-phosphatase
MTRTPHHVLFLCTGNSARSIIAESVLRALGRDRFVAHSAGSAPRGEVHPFALELLQRQDYPIADLRSKSWEEFAEPGAPALDFVFTVCDNAAREVCPVWPGQPLSAHWGIPDPAAVTGNASQRRLAFADALRMLRNRIEIFVNLPVASLDRLSLRAELERIGRLESTPAQLPATKGPARE